MIKASGRVEDGRAFLVLGITDGNIDRLMMGLPIQFEGKDINVPELHTVTIFWGKNEPAVEQMFREHGLIGPETKIYDGDKLPNQGT